MKDRLIRFFLTGLCSTLISSMTLAQPPSSPLTPTSQVAVSAPTGKEAVCEGGAEIIPSGQQSFARKRYVAGKARPKTRLTKPRVRK